MRPLSSRNLVLALALVFGVTACASSGNSNRNPGSSSTRIVRADLEGLGQISALEAVQRLRSQWFRARVNADPPVLYVDGTRRGSSNELSFIRIEEVEEMRYLSSSDATTRYGTGHTGGAILVTMIR